MIFTRRASAEFTSRARHSTDHHTLNALVTEVVHRWMTALEDPAFERLIRRPQL